MPIFRKAEKNKNNGEIDIPIDKILVVGRLMHVSVEGAKNKEPFKTSVADYDEDTIAITPLLRAGKPAHLRRGERISVIYHGPDAVYKFNTIAVGYKRENNVIFPLIAKPQSYSRVQRRNYYRLSLSLEGIYQKGIWKEKGNRKVFVCYKKEHPCYIEDLSGGGLAFHSKEKLEYGTDLRVKFEFTYRDSKPFILKEIIRIVREKKISTIEKKEGYDYIYGAQFVNIKEENQAEILRFVMWSQLERRRFENVRKNGGS